ncbi:MAG: hypothetical protein ACXWLT_01825 [Rhizomicrobium sp.]
MAALRGGLLRAVFFGAGRLALLFFAPRDDAAAARVLDFFVLDFLAADFFAFGLEALDLGALVFLPLDFLALAMDLSVQCEAQLMRVDGNERAI